MLGFLCLLSNAIENFVAKVDDLLEAGNSIIYYGIPGYIFAPLIWSGTFLNVRETQITDFILKHRFFLISFALGFQNNFVI